MILILCIQTNVGNVSIEKAGFHFGSISFYGSSFHYELLQRLLKIQQARKLLRFFQASANINMRSNL